MATAEEFLALVKAGDEAAVERLLDDSPLLARESEGGVPALMLAAYHGHGRLAGIIASRKGYLSVFEAAVVGDGEYLEAALTKDSTGVNDFSADGFTALGYAAFFGHLDATKALLRHGADPSTASKNPLGVMPLHSALANCQTEIARLLIAHGAPLNTPAGEGWTPLHYAAHRGDAELVELLVSKGATQSSGPGGKTPADFAEEQGHGELAAKLRGS
jgi:ankyrin repeat protein